MFENIVDMELVAGISALVTVFIMMMVQYGEFAKNKVSDEKENVKFSWIPYLLIPIVGVAVSVVAGLYVADVAVAKAYIDGNMETLGVAVVGSLAVYGILDKYCLSDLEDAVYKIRGFRDDALGILDESGVVEEVISFTKSELEAYEKVQKAMSRKK